MSSLKLYKRFIASLSLSMLKSAGFGISRYSSAYVEASYSSCCRCCLYYLIAERVSIAVTDTIVYFSSAIFNDSDYGLSEAQRVKQEATYAKLNASLIFNFCAFLLLDQVSRNFVGHFILLSYLQIIGDIF